MTLTLRAAATLLASAALTAGAGAAPAPKRATATKTVTKNYARLVTERDGGHVLGNPDAPNALVEFMSYTCSHCYDFSREGDPLLLVAIVPQGKVSYEIRHLLRDPVDLTAALLTNCGAADRFPANHKAIMAKHPQWMERARTATQAQRTRWSFGTNAARFRAIASDLGFYPIMEARGYNRATLDTCLSDEAKAKSLADTSARDIAAFGLQGTPSFVLNGKLMDNVYNWETLRPKLAEID